MPARTNTGKNAANRTNVASHNPHQGPDQLVHPRFVVGGTDYRISLLGWRYLAIHVAPSRRYVHCTAFGTLAA